MLLAKVFNSISKQSANPDYICYETIYSQIFYALFLAFCDVIIPLCGAAATRPNQTWSR
jgi:hypothetical protein